MRAMRAEIAMLTFALIVTSTSFAQTTPSPSMPSALDAAKTAFKASHWQEALDDALRVLSKDGESRDALYIAGACERQLNKLDDAERHLTTLISLAPSYPFANHRLGVVMFLKAQALAQAGDAEGAREAYSNAAAAFARELERDPKQRTSASSRAIALGRAGRLDDSIQAHEPWIALAPQANDPVVSLAATQALADEPTAAMQTLERLPQKNPAATSSAFAAVAKAFIKMSRWPEAVPFLERAVEANPGSTRLRADLTAAYARASQFDDAATSLEALLTMDPTSEEAETAGEAIKATIGDGQITHGAPGVEPPSLLRLPRPHYPEGEDADVETTVRVLVRVAPPHTVTDAVVVPNRIWKELRESGFEQEAIDAARRARFTAGTRNGQPAELWTVVAVPFHR